MALVPQASPGGAQHHARKAVTKWGNRVLTGTNAVQVQQGLHAHCQPVQELHLLLGLCSFCELLHQSPFVHTTACSALCCSIDACHGVPVVQPAVRPHDAWCCLCLMVHGVACSSLACHWSNGWYILLDGLNDGHASVFVLYAV